VLKEILAEIPIGGNWEVPAAALAVPVDAFVYSSHDFVRAEPLVAGVLGQASAPAKLPFETSTPVGITLGGLLRSAVSVQLNAVLQK
jgi:hypothetical protein